MNRNTLLALAVALDREGKLTAERLAKGAKFDYELLATTLSELPEVVQDETQWDFDAYEANEKLWGTVIPELARDRRDRIASTISQAMVLSIDSRKDRWWRKSRPRD